MASQLFIRHYLGQTPSSPTSPGAGWSDSPDIWLNGTAPAPSPSAIAQAYAEESASTIFLDQQNFIYVRGLDADGSDVKARLWLYYAQSDLVLWPQTWSANGITVAGNAQNWVDVEVTGEGTVAVSDPPFELVPADPPPGQHYCLIAFAQSPPSDVSPAPTQPFSTWDELAAFVAGDPQMAFRNTVDVTPSQPGTWTIVQNVTGAPDGGAFYLGFMCKDMPIGGTVDLLVPGPDEAGTIDRTGIPITNANQTYLVPVTWPAGYSTSATIVFHQGSGPPPGPGASITLTVGIPAPDATTASLKAEGPEGPVHLTVLGTMTYKLRTEGAA